MQFKRSNIKKNKWLIGLLITFSILLILRAILPFVITWYVEKQFDEIDGYSSTIGDLDISLFRGTFQLANTGLYKTNRKLEQPLVWFDKLDAAISWRALLNGKLISELILYNPVVNYVRGKTAEETQTPGDKPWTKVVNQLFPIKIDKLRIVNGEVHLYDYSKPPSVNISATNIDLTITELSNKKRSSAPFHATALVQKQAQLKMNGTISPFSVPISFQIKGILENLLLPQLNDFFRAYANIDIEKGTLTVTADISVEQGKISGYLKPFFKNVTVFSLDDQDKKEDIFQKFWEGIIGTTSEVLENRDDQVAAKIPLAGTIENTQSDPLTIIGTVLKNAFIKALVPKL